MEWLIMVGILTTALCFLLLAWQFWLSRQVLRAHIRAIEAQTCVSLNLEHLRILGTLRQDTNLPIMGEEDLSKEEKDAIDRYFYLANVEYILSKQDTVAGRFATQWLQAIRSAARSRPFVERWRSRASALALDEEFHKFFENTIEESRGPKNLSEQAEWEPDSQGTA